MIGRASFTLISVLLWSQNGLIHFKRVIIDTLQRSVRIIKIVSSGWYLLMPSGAFPNYPKNPQVLTPFHPSPFLIS